MHMQLVDELLLEYGIHGIVADVRSDIASAQFYARLSIKPPFTFPHAKYNPQLRTTFDSRGTVRFSLSSTPDL